MIVRLCFLFFVLASTEVLQARISLQQGDVAPADTSSQIQKEDPIQKRYFLNKIDIVTRSGARYFGKFDGFLGDSVVVIARGTSRTVPSEDIAILTIDGEATQSNIALHAFPLGAYLGLLLFATTEDPQKSAQYLSSYTDMGDVALFGILGGSVLGATAYFLTTGMSGEEVFKFRKEREEHLDDWNRFKTSVQEGKSAGGFRLSVQGTEVSTRVSQFSPPTNAPYMGFYTPYEVSSFNLLRSLRVSVDVSNSLGVGASIIWFGEPGFWYYNSWYQDSDSTYRQLVADEHLGARGYYALLLYRPLSGNLPEWLELEAGVGFGAARLDYSYRKNSLIDRYYAPNVQFSENVETQLNGTFPSWTFFSELRFRISRSLSLGLVIDGVVVPGKDLPAIPEFSIAKRNFGNTSWGFTMGYHF